MRHLYQISAKAALYSPDRQNVLLAYYHHGKYGLPGGHLEGQEDPDSAVRREIREELGIIYTTPLTKRDFFFHDSGKLILGFVGELDQSTPLLIDPVELVAAEWVTIKDIQSGITDAGAYTRFILENA